MIFPNNGKVLVFDDKHEKIAPLLSALSKEKVPFVYYQNEDLSDLPEHPIDNVRLVFLDLELIANGIRTPKDIISSVAARLKKTIHSGNPYILIFWSEKDVSFRDHLLKEFDGNLSNYKPLSHITLPKSTILGLPNPIAQIQQELKDGLAKFESYNAFLFWEAVVNKSSGELVNSLISIFGNSHAGDWDMNVKDLFFKFSKAIAGEAKNRNLSDIDRLKFSLDNINTALIDSIEANINNKIGSFSISGIKEVATSALNDTDISKFNTKLHTISANSYEHFNQGNLYLFPYIDVRCDDLIEKNFNKDNKAKIKIEDIKESKPLLFRLDITPVCDYAQDKGYVRLVSGLKLNGKFKGCFKGNGFNYLLCPKFFLNEEELYLLFDFRYIKSIPQSYVLNYFPSPSLKLRANLVNDIQANVSSHISRPGIIQIEH